MRRWGHFVYKWRRAAERFALELNTSASHQKDFDLCSDFFLFNNRQVGGGFSLKRMLILQGIFLLNHKSVNKSPIKPESRIYFSLSIMHCI